MTNSLQRALDDVFRTVAPAAETLRQRAEALGDDAGTLSRLLSGKLGLTRNRARKWAERLYPNEPDAAADLIDALLAAEQPTPRTSAIDFFEDLVDRGGAAPADRIQELLEALKDTEDALICIEYRDGPRAGPASKYESLGRQLVEAVNAGVAVAMFQPFGGDDNIPFPEDKNHSRTHSFASVAYMRKIRNDCRSTYNSYISQVSEKRKKHLRLYERCVNLPYLTSGFQAKLFFIQFRERNELKTFHWRILQWVSTPSQDLIIYRGQTHVEPEAVRDCFFPVPHLYEQDKTLVDISDNDLKRARTLSGKAREMPKGPPVWRPF